MPEDAPVPGAVEPTPEVPTGASPKDDWESRFKYLLADFENFRRRSAKEREAATRQARGAMLRELLPLVEAFRSASVAAEHLPSADPLRRGFELLEREWQTFLRHEGVEPVTAVGRPFQAEEAEAVAETPSDATTPDGSVAEVVQQGYRFFGGLLRPAKVVVARNKAESPSPAVAAAAGDEQPEAPS